MDIIVFGDDWQAHVSTTQHLINHLSENDRIIWFNSMGMRSPSLSGSDFLRLYQKGKSIVKPAKRSANSYTWQPLAVVQPKIIPLHNNTFIQKLNRISLARQLESLISEHQFENPVILTVNPVVCRYLPGSLKHNLCYLRLDNYALYGGVDQALAMAAEHEIFEQAEHLFYTAKELCPDDTYRVEATYLPQGVDNMNFTQLELPEKPSKTLGFFGLIEPSRYDFELIARVAKTNPDWKLEFIGNMTYTPEQLSNIPNIVWRNAVPYMELTEATKDWTAAWIPYHLNDLTMAINPLKLREYLALGLPVLSTPLPEVLALQPHVSIFTDEHDVSDVLADIITSDSNSLRHERRESVANDNWTSRSQILRAQLQAVQSAKCRLQSKLQLVTG